MTDGEPSVLARKLASGAKRSVESFPDLARFAGLAGKTVQAVLSTLLRQEIEAEAAASSLSPLAAFLVDQPDTGVYYWLADEHGAPAALIAISPAFAAALAARLLGDELSLCDEDREPAILDFEMAASFLELFAPAFTEAIHKKLACDPPARLGARQGMRAKSEAMGELEAAGVFSLRLDLRFGETTAQGAVSFAFMQSFVERAGLMRSQRQALPPPRDKAAWTNRLRANILNVEFPLSIVLDRVATNIGALSRLKVGEIIDIDPGALQAMEVSAATPGGPVTVARGRLGAVQTRKAVKLTTGIDPDFVRGL